MSDTTIYIAGGRDEAGLAIPQGLYNMVGDHLECYYYKSEVAQVITGRYWYVLRIDESDPWRKWSRVV